jgi:hypothetical protein
MDTFTLSTVMRIGITLVRTSTPNLKAEECLAQANAIDGAVGWAYCSRDAPSVLRRLAPNPPPS